VTDKCHVIESGRLAPKNDDGTYPITIITEGKGSTGIYSRALLENQAHIFSNSLSFMDHPVNADKPWERSVKDIGGRIVGATYAQEENGQMTVKGNYKPRAEYAAFIEEYADAIGLSIYRGASGTVQEDGRLLVESFDESDPYASVDIVVAAGRGGKFDRAAEALRVIESSLGTPDATERATTPVAEKRDTVNEDDKQDLLNRFGALVDAKLGELFVKFTQYDADHDEANAEEGMTAEQAAQEAVAAYAAAVESVDKAELLPSQRKAILESAAKGADIAPLIESAKAVADEAKTAFGAQKPASAVRYGLVESADSANDIPTIDAWSHR